MEFGSIEREMVIAASVETVFEVVSDPAHIADWWSASTSIEPFPGSDGELVWIDDATGRRDAMRITVSDVDPPRLFTFRWTHTDDNPHALLVRFELTEIEGGTRLRMTETGFRDKGWSAAVLADEYRAHEDGWALHLPRLVQLAERLP